VSDDPEAGNARPRKMAPAPYSFLPDPEDFIVDPKDPPAEGWWRDPLNADPQYQRYYDGTTWTHYLRARSLKGWTQIFEDVMRVRTEVDPVALGIPRPPVVPDPAPEPPTAGWWEDPIEPKLKQARYFDGTQWTDLITPTKEAGPRLVVRRRDPEEVQKEQKAARAAAKAQQRGGAPPKSRWRWPWSRHGG
jgi:hypothetical protein